MGRPDARKMHTKQFWLDKEFRVYDQNFKKVHLEIHGVQQERYGLIRRNTFFQDGDFEWTRTCYYGENGDHIGNSRVGRFLVQQRPGRQ